MTPVQRTPTLFDQHKEEVRAAIDAGASFTMTYGVMNVLATIIACYGLLVDSAAGIISARKGRSASARGPSFTSTATIPSTGARRARPRPTRCIWPASSRKRSP